MMRIWIPYLLRDSLQGVQVRSSSGANNDYVLFDPDLSIYCLINGQYAEKSDVMFSTLVSSHI